MSFGRILGQSSNTQSLDVALSEEPATESVEQAHSAHVEAPETQPTSEETGITNTEEADVAVNTEETSAEQTEEEVPAEIQTKKRLHSKFVNSLERYEILGAVVESTADYLAPTLLRARESAPDAVVSAVKAVDTFCFNTLRAVEEIFIMHQIRERIPNHEVR